MLLEEEPVSSRKVVVKVEDMDRQDDPDNITYVLTTRQGQNVTLNCSDFGGEMISWTKQGGRGKGLSPDITFYFQTLKLTVQAPPCLSFRLTRPTVASTHAPSPDSRNQNITHFYI